MRTVKDCSYMSWQEFGNVFEVLLKKIEKHAHENNITFDAVIPILRSGGVPASAMAIHFNIPNILPIQFKSFGNKLKCIMPLRKFDFSSQTPCLLIYETNTATGKTAKDVIKATKKQYHLAKFSIQPLQKFTAALILLMARKSIFMECKPTKIL